VNYNKVFIGIGSNVGDKLQNIENAIKLINKNTDCEVVKCSSIYESKPFGNVKQDNYYNRVVRINTNLEPIDLFKLLKNIENEIGRTKTERWGPREIDLDILLYDNLVYSDDTLKIPHIGIQERDFVIVPLTEIEPEITHPVLKKKISKLIINADKNIIMKISTETKRLSGLKSAGK
jgi:2-amino-4-hydroxy-6-hydroxymethyldihydropteridine diphosphokinase